jgi:hypothetical protein
MKSVILWVDAICINQEDDVEKSSQVILMRDIYQAAEETLVWLGEAADDSGLAFSLIEVWANAHENIDAFVLQCPSAFDKELWESLEKLFRRPWWTRTWVYQEFVVSKEIFFICGPDSLSNKKLRDALMSRELFLSSTARNSVDWAKTARVRYSAATRIHRLQYQRLVVQLRHLRKRRKLPLNTLKSFDLLKLIMLTADLEATDPRDKLYALLGIDDVCDINVSVDYGHLVSKVYTDFAINYITARSSLEILSQARIGFGSRDQQIPSWVPDLRNISVNGQDISTTAHCASGSRKARALIDNTRSLPFLITTGLVCDIVSGSASTEEIWGPQHEQWRDLALGSTTAHPTGISRVQAFFRTMIADATGYGYGRPDFKNSKERERFFTLAKGFMLYSGMESMMKCADGPLSWNEVQEFLCKFPGNSDYVAYFQWFMKLIPDEPVCNTDRQLVQPFLDSDSPFGEMEWPQGCEKLTPKEQLNIALEYKEHAGPKTHRKSFFTTKKGYMGLGPSRIQNGDQICIIFGCQQPLLLRKTNDTFYLIGGVYVYGMMDGEMIAQLEAGKLTEEEFILH